MRFPRGVRGTCATVLGSPQASDTTEVTFHLRNDVYWHDGLTLSL